APFPFLVSNMALSSWRVGGNASDDDGEVVRPAASVRQGDQDLARRLRIARFDHDAMNVIVFDVGDEAVAAPQDVVSGFHRETSDVRGDMVLDSEGHRDLVLTLLLYGLLGRGV